MKPDFFDECFDPKAGMTSDQFGQTFCRVCLNPECQRSSVDGSAWAQRIATQEERLLIRPNFADPNDPQYRDITRLDFRSMFREALAVEIADRRNDWSIPTDADIAQEAAKVVEALPPTPPPPPEDGIVFRTRIQSASGNEYEVTLNDDGVWACDCPAYQFARANPCKHIQQAQVAKPVEPEPVVEPEPPPPVVRGPVQPLPRLRNIPQPPGGLMVDGSMPERSARSAPSAQDPWALPSDKMPPAKGTVVPVGAKVIMGKK
jgi:hypothetical protein